MSEEDINKSRFCIQNFVAAPSHKGLIYDLEQMREKRSKQRRASSPQIFLRIKEAFNLHFVNFTYVT